MSTRALSSKHHFRDFLIRMAIPKVGCPSRGLLSTVGPYRDTGTFKEELSFVLVRCSFSLVFLRGCADRSWSAGRSAFPSVAHPAFSNQPPHDDHHLGERHPEIDHPPYPLHAPHQLLVCVMPRVRPLRHPTLPGL